MKIYLVGGAVRDRLLGLPVTDRDYVVVGATPEQLLAQGFRAVGRDFPVFLHPKTGEEYALARQERKTARGHQGFAFAYSPEVTLEEDLLRRDLTINAIAEDSEGNRHDPYGGVADIEQRVLRHVSPSFAEDPLRILRLLRFYARFAPLHFRIALPTLALVKAMVEDGALCELTAERVWGECAKALGYDEPWHFFTQLAAIDGLSVLLGDIIPDKRCQQQMTSTLQTACQGSAHIAPRLAAWLLPSPEAAAAMAQRLPLPNTVKHWIALLATHAHTARNWQYASAQEKWRLLKHSGSLRQAGDLPELLATLGIDESTRHAIINQVHTVHALDINALQQSGVSGAALGAAIQEAQCALLDEV